MPITEAEMPYGDMVKTAKDGHTCGNCGGVLSVAWGGKGYILRCGNDLSHNTINRHDKQYDEQLRIVKEVQHMDSKSLMTMSEAKMIDRVGMAKFPQDLTSAEKRLLAQVAITYGFDPLMGEVTIYQGRPWVSIDGRYRKAQETGELDGVETRPANKQERVDWEMPDGDYFFRAEVYRKGASHPFVGWGRVRGSETKPGSKGDPTSTFKPVQSNPQRMAEKRAEAMGLRKGFHIPLPSIEDIGTPEADEVKVTVEPMSLPSNPPTESKDTSQAEQGQPASNATPKETMTRAVPEKEIVRGEHAEAKPSEEVEGIDMDWLRESLNRLSWTTVTKWLRERYPDNAKGTRVSEIVKNLSIEEREAFAQEVEQRLTMV